MKMFYHIKYLFETNLGRFTFGSRVYFSILSFNNLKSFKIIKSIFCSVFFNNIDLPFSDFYKKDLKSNNVPRIKERTFDIV
jgi:hypothetical protein